MDSIKRARYWPLFRALALISTASNNDRTLMDIFIGKDEGFNGSCKDLNSGFRRGLWLAMNEPDNFRLWNEGWTQGTGWTIETIAEWYVEAVDRQIKEAI